MTGDIILTLTLIYVLHQSRTGMNKCASHRGIYSVRPMPLTSLVLQDGLHARDHDRLRYQYG